MGIFYICTQETFDENQTGGKSQHFQIYLDVTFDTTLCSLVFCALLVSFLFFFFNFPQSDLLNMMGKENATINKPVVRAADQAFNLKQ